MKRSVVIATILLSNSLLFAQVPAIAGVASASDPAPAPGYVQPSPAKRKTKPAVSATSEGLIFSTADGSDTLRVHGYVQAQNRKFDSNMRGEDLDTFLF